MGVAKLNCGKDGRDGIRSWGTAGAPFWLTGFALGLGGIARPKRGVLDPLFARLPGIGGRRRGAGEDMLDGGGAWASLLSELELVECFSSLALFFSERLPLHLHIWS